MELISQIVIFLILSSVIILFTKKLAREGQALSQLTQISGGFIGFVFLAIVTSMPEFVMSFSAVYVVKEPDLCGGDLFGSNLFNLSIIGLIEVFISHRTFISGLDRTISKVLFNQLFLTIIPIIFIITRLDWGIPFLSVPSLVIILFYIYSVRKTKFEEEKEDVIDSDESLTATIVRFVIFSLIIIFAAILVTKTCDRISHITGLGNSFLGALLLATTSSLPEIIMTISLVKLKENTMAIYNLLGSNLFNMLILAVTDLFMAKNLYIQMGFNHIIPVSFCLLTTLVVYFSIRLKVKRTLISGIIILLNYAFGMFFLFQFTHLH